MLVRYCVLLNFVYVSQAHMGTVLFVHILKFRLVKS